MYIAIGSNLGNRVFNVQSAISRMAEAGVKVNATGFLYESPPMYVENQPPFLNTCVSASTSLPPQELLVALKKIEQNMGRTSTGQHGPRCIDLDIIFYDDQIMDLPNVCIPHPRLCERFFVLSPLRDIEPDLFHPVMKQTVSQLYGQLATVSPNTCKRVFPAINSEAGGLISLGGRSVVMGILNVTPDSFSDGGLYVDVNAAVARASEMIAQGADIIDVGGESTRPNATVIEAAEEQQRVMEIIRKIRTGCPSTPVSIDTYKSATARAAVAAGASIVNDVSGGMIDPDMRPTVAELQVPYICMHSGRVGVHPVTDYGDNQPSVFDDESARSPQEIVRIVRSQLAGRVKACLAAGIYRWNLVLDPGLGFGKSGDANFAIIANLNSLFAEELKDYPVMIGASRKRFVRDLANNGKDWVGSEQSAMLGTAAVTVAAASSGVRADFHRVHDVSEIRRVLDVSDMIFRSHRGA